MEKSRRKGVKTDRMETKWTRFGIGEERGIYREEKRSRNC